VEGESGVPFQGGRGCRSGFWGSSRRRDRGMERRRAEWQNRLPLDASLYPSFAPSLCLRCLYKECYYTRSRRRRLVVCAMRRAWTTIRGNRTRNQRFGAIHSSGTFAWPVLQASLTDSASVPIVTYG
jgi:hypothetical protein